MKRTRARTAIFAVFGIGTALLIGGQRLQGEEIYSAGERRGGEKEEPVPEGLTTDSGGTVTLEGGWEAYDSTGLTVKRSITVERDGEAYQAKVFTPVLTRRGAVFLSSEQIGEMLTIKSDMEALVEEVSLIQEKAKGLEGRYASLIGQARQAMMETFPAEQHRGKVELIHP